MTLSTVQPAALERYLNEQVRRMHSAMSGQGALSILGVHKARVASRRLKAALDVVEPLVNAKPLFKLAKTAKKIRKSLGTLRELDVMIEQLSAVHEPAIERYRDTLRVERSETAKAIQGTLDKWCESLTIGKSAADALKEVRPAIASLLREGVLSDFDSFHDKADVAMKRGARQDMHALRIAGKRLRYQLEITGEVGFKPARIAAKEFERVQDALGEWHDEIVLAQHVARHAASDVMVHNSTDDASRLLAFAGDRLRRANAALSRFRDSWQANQQQLSDVIRSISHGTVSRPTADRDRRKKR